MVKIFISYSSKNIKQLEDIVSALTPLKDSGTISELWYDREKLHGGDDFHSKIIDNMYSSDIIIILMSRDFFHSDYCKNTELPLSKNLMKDGKSIVVPILLSSCAWEKYINATTHILPSRDTPILKKTGNKREILFSKIAKEIEQISNTIIDEKDEKLEQKENTDGFIPNNIKNHINENKKELLIALGVLMLTLFTYFMYLNSTINSLKNRISTSKYYSQPTHQPNNLIDNFSENIQQYHYVEHKAEIKKISLKNKECMNRASTLLNGYGYTEENRNSKNLWLLDGNYKAHVKCYT